MHCPWLISFCSIFEDGAETVCSDTSAAGLVVAYKTAVILFWLYVIAAEVCFVDYALASVSIFFPLYA